MTRKRPKTEAEGYREEFDYHKKHLDKLWERSQDAAERLQDIEVRLNLVTRLITALCVEKLGMRIGVLKRLIKKIEKEVIGELQVSHLEQLYKLGPRPEKRPIPQKPKSEDRWEDIS